MKRTEKTATSAYTHIVLLVTLLPQAAFALDLSYRPQLRIGTRASDNVRWSADNQEAALGFDNGGGVELKAETLEWKSKINPTFNFRRFAIGEDLDADEYGVRSQHQWLFSERVMFGANLDYVRDSTLTTELSDAGIQNQVANRDTITAQPNITILFDDKTTLNGSYLYSDVSFDTDANGQLVDYNYEQFSASVTRAWRENLRFFVSGFASEFETPEFEGRTRTYGVQGGAEYAYRPDMGATLSVGYTTSDIEFQTQFLTIDPGPPPRLVLGTRDDEASTSGPIASASLYKDFEHTRTRLDYNRRVSPSIRGSQQLEDDILFSAERDISRTLRLGFRGGYNMRSAESEDVASANGLARTRQLNRDQALLAPWVSYKFSREWLIRAEYRFVRNSFEESVRREPVYSNAIFFSVNFNGESRPFHMF